MKYKKLKKLIASMLAIFMVFGIISIDPTEVLAAYTGQIWVNGERVYSGRPIEFGEGKGKAVYDKDAKTLTLDNAKLDKENNQGRIIYIAGDIAGELGLTIVLKGANTITGSGDGIFVDDEANLTIKGDGSLTSKISGSGTQSSITLMGELIIDGVDIEAIHTNKGFGISAGQMTIRNGANVSSKTESQSFFATSGMTVSNSTVIAETNVENNPAINITNGNLTITDKAIVNVTATGTVGANAIRSSKNVEIKNSEVTTTSANNTGIYAVGSLSIADKSTVTATSKSTALMASGDIIIKDSEVLATSSDAWGMYAFKMLSIIGDSTVIAKGKVYGLGGAVTTMITPITDESVEVYVGTNKDDVTLLKGAPFKAMTSLNPISVSVYPYFHSEKHTHTPSTEWSTDAENHWHKCTTDGEKTNSEGHAFGEWVIDKTATETTEGSQHRKCSVCQYKDTTTIPKIPHTHTPSTVWSKDATNHWHECTTDGEKTDSAGHTFGELVINKAATETAEGSQHRECSVCQYKDTTTIPKIPHTHTPSTVWSKDATNHWHECTANDGDKTDSKGHEFGELVIDKAATETAEGSQHRECSVCQYKDTTTIPKIPHTHTPSTEWSKDATNHWHECTANDGDKTDSKGHTFGELVIDKAATETAEGSQHRECSVCQYKDTTEIPKLAHTHTPSTVWSKDATNHWNECKSDDGEHMNEVAHTAGEAATVEHAQVCSVCGYEIAPKLSSKNALVDTITGIKVEYKDGFVFETGITLGVTLKTQTEIEQLKVNVEKVSPGFSIMELYDIKLMKDGVAVQPNGKVMVSIPLTKEMKVMDELQSIYIDENGTVTINSSEIKGEMITFVVDHFSHYGVIGKAKPINPGNSNNTNNGTNQDTGVVKKQDDPIKETGAFESDRTSVVSMFLLMGCYIVMKKRFVKAKN